MNLIILQKKGLIKIMNELSETKKKAITNGPSKLCIAFSIDKSENYKRLYEEGDFYIEEGEKDTFKIMETKRIGIDYAEEAIDFPWRFYIEGNKYISKK